MYGMKFIVNFAKATHYGALICGPLLYPLAIFPAAMITTFIVILDPAELERCVKA